MKFKYLEKWVIENSKQNLVFDEILKFEDQYKIKFRNRKEYLQISLSSQDCFCFFTKNNVIPFEKKSALEIFNQHLHMAKLSEITISSDDRIIKLMLEKIDIYNKKLNYEMILEFIPRFQNIILTKDKIIDCIKKISFAENRQRQILPGVAYIAPNTIFKVTKGDIKFSISIDAKNNFEENSKDEKRFSEMNLLLEELYYQHLFLQRNEKIKRQKIKVVEQKIKKKKKKVEKLKLEFKDSMKIEKWLHFAELLKANFPKIKPGMAEIELKNYYKNGFPIVKIPIDKVKNPQENIEYYFKKHRKSKDGKKKIAKQIIVTRKEIEELEKEVFDLEEKEIFLENKKEKEQKIKKISKYKKISVDSNWEIYIGRTGKENDELTTKLAKNHDWWFHTRIFRGTHILLRNLNKNELTDELKLVCCRLAAYYSKAKKSSNVPVDYTQIRYVCKPRKSLPGFVTYKNQKTLYVNPLSMRDAVKIIKN